MFWLFFHLWTRSIFHSDLRIFYNTRVYLDMSNTINVNISTTNDNSVATQPTSVDDTIRAEARRRLVAEAEKARAEAEATRLKAKREQEEKESRILDERVKLMAEEEQVRLMARRLALEAEAKRLADEKEAAIKAEMERLKNRSQLEILEDRVAELTAQMTSLRSDRLLEIRARLGTR